MEREQIEVTFTKAGGRKHVMAALGVSKQTLSDWKRKGEVPARHAVMLERMSGVSRSKLCPAFPWKA